MSYDQRTLLHDAVESLRQNPSLGLQGLSQKLRVSTRTIQKAINLQTGRSFRDLREEIVVTKAKSLLVSEPALAIKALSFALGYKSPRSFARAVRRVTGISPEELRSAIVEERTRREEMSKTAKM